MNELNQINLNNGFVAIFNDEREWIYKAVPFVGKKPVREDPVYQVINDIEKHYQDDFNKCLVTVVKDVSRYLIG